MGKIIGGILAVVLLVLGVWWWTGKGDVKESATGTQNTASESAVQQGAPQSEEKGVISSIKDAMGLGKAMQCTYSLDTNGKTYQSTVVVDGQKFMATSVVDKMTVYALFDGETQYTWTSNDKKGFKMSKACLDELKNSVKDFQGDKPEMPKAEDIQKDFDVAKNVSCTPAGGATLTVPADVEFTDQCAMLRETSEMMKNFKDKMPAGVTIPNLPSGN